MSIPPSMASHAAAGEAAVTTLVDGRSLRWREFGDREGFPILALHGLPGSGRKFANTDRAARERGLRVIAPDRWGYGGTSRHPAPTLAAFAADMAAFADQFGIDRFAVLGVSGGGPYAAAVAATLGARVAAVALVSPVGPIAGAGERPSLSAFHHLCFRVLPHTPGVLPAAFRLFRLACRHAEPLACRITTLRADRIDRTTIARPDVGPRLAATFREGLEPGITGPLTDMGLFSRAWNVDLAAIVAPAKVWIGTRDTSVPIAAARLLARLIPGAECQVLEGGGHLWLALHYPDVLAWIDGARLAPQQGPQRASAALTSARVSGTP